jgi:hypothetical protein
MLHGKLKAEMIKITETKSGKWKRPNVSVSLQLLEHSKAHLDGFHRPLEDLI